MLTTILDLGTLIILCVILFYSDRTGRVNERTINNLNKVVNILEKRIAALESDDDD